MRGPEAKLYQKFKKATPKILWHRIENLAIPGMPDVLGYTENFFGRAPRFGELETL
jgi:hypothetical protein